MSFQERLTRLTGGYSRHAQMSLSTANILGYLRDPFYLFVTTSDDDTLYTIQPRVLDSGQFEFSAHNERKPVVVDGDYTVLVYIAAAPAPQSEEAQIDALWNFVMQYPPKSLIRKFLCEHTIAWLERNREAPSLYSEYIRMKIALCKMEDDLADLEEIL